MTPDKTPSDAQLIAELEAAGVAFMAFRGGLGGTKDIWTTRGSQDARKIAAGLRAVLAKWGSPVVAGEPQPSAEGPPELWLQLHGDCAEPELSEPVDYTAGDVTWCWHSIHDSDVRYVRADLATTPQPTQAQAGAVPLTPEQAQDLIELESWGPDAIGLNAQLLRTIRRTEAAHGIKGGQHADR